MKLKKIFGTKAFYLGVLSIALPIMLQQGITSIVSLLDNIMVGKLGEDSLAGVAVSNQILFVYNLLIFGGLAGPGIFISQFFGSGDDEHLRQSFRFKFVLGLLVTVLAILVILIFKENIINLVFSNDEVNEEIAISESIKYLDIMLFSLPFFAISQVCSSSLREIGKTIIPMISGIIAILINVCLNYVLIFGHFGFPKFGVEGAAIATLISRFVETMILAVFIISKKMIFINDGIFKLHVDKDLFKTITKKGAPLLLNEFLWSMSLTMIVFCYAFRGKAVIAAVSIATVVLDFNFIVVNGLASAISILVGKELGANRLKEAKENSYKLIVFAIILCTMLGTIFSFFAPSITVFYNISAEAEAIAKSMIKVICFCMPISAFFISGFFTIRAGGKSIYTFLCDSVFQMLITLPFAFILCKFTNINIIYVYLGVQCFDIIKGIIGLSIIRYGNWANNLTII